MRQPLILLLLTGILCLAAPSALPELSGEWSRPYGPILPGAEPIDADGDRTIVAVRVLCNDDGRLVPLAGARVSGWSEEPGPGFLVAHKLGEGVTDEFGFANVTWTGEFCPFHWVVWADGWATWHDAGIGGSAVILEPARTHRFRLLDPLGRPLVDARVEAFHGCPHAPILHGARSDKNGIVVLQGLAEEPRVELWIVAPGVAPGPYDIPEAASGDIDELSALLTDPGRTASGVVVGPDGTPRPGVIVREIGYPRGPVTTTDALGRFVLHGIDDAAVGFFRPDATYHDRPSVGLSDFEEDVPLRIVMGPDQPRALGEGEVRHSLDVLVLMRWSSGSTGRENHVPVSLSRLADGFVVRGKTGGLAAGLLAVQAPPGEYRVVVGGGLSTVVRGETTVRVPRPDRSPVRFVLDRQPSLHTRGARLREGVVLRVPGASRSMSYLQYPTLPAEGPATLVTFEQTKPVALAIGPLEDGRRTVKIPEALAAAEPTRVRVRVRSEDPGVNLDGVFVEWDEGEWDLEPRLADDGRWIADTQHVGRGVLFAEADGHQREWRIIDIPLKPTVIDLPDIVLRRTEERTFRVVDAAGRPVTEVQPERVGGGNELLDDEGRFTIEVGPCPEAWIMMTPRHIRPRSPEHWCPLRISLDLASDPEIRFPGGRITIEVRDEAGRELPAVGYVDLEPLEGQGELDLRGVPAGSHVLLVGSPGRLGEIRRIVLRDGEHRRIALTLRPR